MIGTPQAVLMAAVLAMVAIMIIGSLIRDQKIKAKKAEFHQAEKKKNAS